MSGWFSLYLGVVVSASLPHRCYDRFVSTFWWLAANGWGSSQSESTEAVQEVRQRHLFPVHGAEVAYSGSQFLLFKLRVVHDYGRHASCL